MASLFCRGFYLYLHAPEVFSMTANSCSVSVRLSHLGTENEIYANTAVDPGLTPGYPELSTEYLESKVAFLVLSSELY